MASLALVFENSVCAYWTCVSSYQNRVFEVRRRPFCKISKRKSCLRALQERAAGRTIAHIFFNAVLGNGCDVSPPPTQRWIRQSPGDAFGAADAGSNLRRPGVPDNGASA
jgi:hypothetical protein